MCQIMEEIRDKSYNAGWAGGAVKEARKMTISLAKKGWDANQIAEITEYDLKTVENWLNETETSAGR